MLWKATRRPHARKGNAAEGQRVTLAARHTSEFLLKVELLELATDGSGADGVMDGGKIRHRACCVCAGTVLTLISACGGEIAPSIQIGDDKGGSTYGLDTLPFEIQRADGTILTGHAAVRILRVDFSSRDARGLSVCSGGFTLDQEHSSVPIGVDCTGDGILHGTVTIAWADHGEGTFTERSGRTSTFRYGSSQQRRPLPLVAP